MLPTAFVDLKNLIGASLNLSPDALHVHVGLILFLGGAALIRSERRFLYSFLGLLALSVIGELFDLSYDHGQGYRLRWLNGIKDILNTVLWPAAWLIAGPHMLRILRRRPSLPPAAPDAGENSITATPPRI